MNDLERKRIEWIDVARGIGILLVIIGHQGLGMISGWFYSFHMPLFFILSGVCFKPTDNYKSFLTHKMRTMIIPYFFLGTVGIIFQFFFYQYDFHWLLKAYISLILQRKYMTIWFIAALFVTENMFFFIHLIKKRCLAVSVSFLMFLVGAIYYRLGGINLPWCIDTAFMAMPFFCVGHYGKGTIEKLTCKDCGYKEILRIASFFVIGGGTGTSLVCQSEYFRMPVCHV